MLDKDTIAQLIADIGEDVFLRLSKQFLAETENRLTALNAAWRAGAWSELARHAHSLKSTAQSFGLTETGFQARELQLAADHLDIETVNLALPKLVTIATAECAEFQRMREELGSDSDL